MAGIVPEFGWLSHTLLSIGASVYIVRKGGEARTVLLWLVAVWGLPFLGVLIYLVFGINRVADIVLLRQRSERHLGNYALYRPPKGLHRQSELACAVNRVLDRSGDMFLQGGNDIGFRPDALAALEEMFDAIKAAKSHIHLETYIIGHDSVGKRLMDLLLEKAREGVTVRLLYDGYGTIHARRLGFFRHYRHPLLHYRHFSHANFFRLRFQANIRNHRKLLIIDGTEAFTGGINFHDTYLKGTYDYNFRIRGPIVGDLQYTFLRDWHLMTGEQADALLTRANFPILSNVGTVHARVQNGAPTATGHLAITHGFFGAISSAKRQVLIATPYFSPSEDILTAMRIADIRGVDVRLLLPGANNHQSIFYAARSLYTRLLDAGVEIYERKAPFSHIKAMVVDDELAIIGSANLDNRSLRLNYETNLFVFDAAFAGQIKADLLSHFAQSRQIELNRWCKRSATDRFLENSCALLAPTI
ncbi:MAG: cardiolipin synthase [Kiritimatiellia bacterium]